MSRTDVEHPVPPALLIERDPLGASLRCLHIAFLLALLLPLVAVVSNLLMWKTALPWWVWAFFLVLAAGLLRLGTGVGGLIGRLRPTLESLSEAQTRLLDQLPVRSLPTAIAASAGVSLLLELAVIRWLGTEFSRDTGLPCEVSVAADAGQLGSEAATQLFRVAQESLNNVRRHADATRATLSLSFVGGLWILTVRDDGRGFDPGGRPAGYGVMGMHERARLLGGTLSIRSAPGQGTVVELRVVPGTPAAPPSPYGT